MFYADLKNKPAGVFKRLTGVRPTTFLDMCEALEKHLSARGRRPKHCLEDRLLLTLMYWREYRTYAHIGQTYGLSESAVWRTISMMEKALLRCGAFRLPGKKALTQSDTQYKAILSIRWSLLTPRNARWSVPKKAAAFLQRQEEASHAEGTERHTQKAQLVADIRTKQIVATAFSSGKRHDFNTTSSCSAKAGRRCCPRQSAWRTAAI